MVLTIRAMTPDDAPTAVALASAEGWRDRTRFWDLVFRTETCRAIAGEVDGRVVATGLAVVNGTVGWLGGLIVAKARRGRGYGRAMTEELIRRLQAAGCVTLSLEATDAGRPMYERLGFHHMSAYHQIEAGHLNVRPDPPPDRLIRPLRPDDLAAVCELDQLATGEDRSAALRVLAELNGGWILEQRGGPHGGRPAGFLLPTERTYGAVVAPRFDDGLFLLDLHRWVAPDESSVRAGIPHEHQKGWQELIARGWSETWRAPRLILGPSIDWQPDWIWGQINSAMG
jgi:GNAT superfamily N-acetyltransferase